jgi:hypothetical protein
MKNIHKLRQERQGEVSYMEAVRGRGRTGGKEDGCLFVQMSNIWFHLQMLTLRRGYQEFQDVKIFIPCP